MERDKINAEMAKKKIDSQFPDKIKISKSEIKIDNNGSPEDMYKQFVTQYYTNHVK